MLKEDAALTELFDSLLDALLRHGGRSAKLVVPRSMMFYRLPLNSSAEWGGVFIHPELGEVQIELRDDVPFAMAIPARSPEH